MPAGMASPWCHVGLSPLQCEQNSGVCEKVLFINFANSQISFIWCLFPKSSQHFSGFSALLPRRGSGWWSQAPWDQVTHRAWQEVVSPSPDQRPPLRQHPPTHSRGGDSPRCRDQNAPFGPQRFIFFVFYVSILTRGF